MTFFIIAGAAAAAAVTAIAVLVTVDDGVRCGQNVV